jgi:uncharacterized protein (TIGR02117 family)
MHVKFLFIISLTILLCGSASCSENEKHKADSELDQISAEYPIYIINYSYHTGIVIPVNSETTLAIKALSYFRNFKYTDIGWGEEKFYQDPSDNYCMGARAILLPNRSVFRIEGYNGIDFIKWNSFVVMLKLNKDQFTKLLIFIDESFTKQSENETIITSQKNSGSVIFFKSIYKYHLLNTCNTWIAEALKISGLDVSPFLTITAGQLYNEIKDKGTIIKALK